MAQLLLLTIGALVVGAIGFGVATLISGSDPGLQPVEPEGRALALPADRPLVESDFGAARFDTALRGYRMAQVDTALRRAAYDIGYKQELIGVLEAEVSALRDGRTDEADKLRAARQAALSAISDRAKGDAHETEPASPATPDLDATAEAEPAERPEIPRPEEMRLP
jgi:DivIVA domain-containing protein